MTILINILLVTSWSQSSQNLLKGQLHIHQSKGLMQDFFIKCRERAFHFCFHIIFMEGVVELISKTKFSNCRLFSLNFAILASFFQFIFLGWERPHWTSPSRPKPLSVLLIHLRKLEDVLPPGKRPQAL